MPWLYLLLAALLLGPDLAVAAAVSAPGKRTVHVVRAGETLVSIAARYQVPLAKLRQWNRLRGDKILAGQRLQVWVAPPTQVYRVKKGDTLTRIAEQYGASPEYLRELNGLRSDKILVGQRLALPGTARSSPRPPPLSPSSPAPTPPEARPFPTRAEAGAARNAAASRAESATPATRAAPPVLDSLPGAAARAKAPAVDSLPSTAGRLLVPAADTSPGPVTPAPVAASNSVRGMPTPDLVAVAVSTSDAPAPASTPVVRAPPGSDADSSEVPADSLDEDVPDSLDFPLPSSLQPALTDSADEGPPEEYVVRPGESLSEIAERFEVGVELLRQLNRLKRGHLHAGQKLRLRPSWQDEGIHVVQPGESLTAIALRYRLDLSRLRELNGIEGDRLLVGQKLRLRAAPPAVHIVERGDALWEIAAAYGMDPGELRRLNGLTSDRVYPGQELRLKGKKSDRYELYVVQRGENLTEIARLHQMSVSELKRLNKLRGSVIHPGQKLKARPLLGQTAQSLESAEIDWAVVQQSVEGIARIEADNGPYYIHRPAVDRQPHTRYFESSTAGPLAVYQQAARLWQGFEERVSRMGRLSRTLEGWHVVVDPGHGGLDPGTIVEALDGSGDRLYVVEDEYVFDTAIRAYVLLRLHGARVSMTLLSPNHLQRHTSPPTQTFVNEKNEVYNSRELNQPNRPQDWPRGANLTTRVRLARRFFADTPKDRRIFLSFHADIDPHSPAVPLVLYYTSRNGRRQDPVSRAFARGLLPSLGAGARTRGQPLGVLRDNPAQVKVLLEMRNLAYTDQAWALRFEQLRQRDAEKVVRGVLDYARRRNLSARR